MRDLFLLSAFPSLQRALQLYILYNMSLIDLLKWWRDICRHFLCVAPPTCDALNSCWNFFLCQLPFFSHFIIFVFSDIPYIISIVIFSYSVIVHNLALSTQICISFIIMHRWNFLLHQQYFYDSSAYWHNDKRYLTQCQYTLRVCHKLNQQHFASVPYMRAILQCMPTLNYYPCPAQCKIKLYPSDASVCTTTTL